MESFEVYMQTAKECWYAKDADSAITNYLKAIEINPSSSKAHNYLGIVQASQENLVDSIASFNRAIAIDLNYAEAHFNIGVSYRNIDNKTEAHKAFLRAITVKPDYGDAYWNLVDLLITQSTSESYGQAREITEQYLKNCRVQDPIRSLLAYLQSTLYCGLANPATLSQLIELEEYIYKNRDHLTTEDSKNLFAVLIFLLPNIRDNVKSNRKISKLIASVYSQNYIGNGEHSQEEYSKSEKEQVISQPLRIGFLSLRFRRHSMTWCSTDIIKELSKITPHIYLYQTLKSVADDKTELLKSIATKFYCHDQISDKENSNLSKKYYSTVDLIKEIRQDNIDVLIDLDSTTALPHANVLAAKPAPICISWLGYDSPQMDESDYFLVDEYTHPKGIDIHYVEQLLRMPNSLVAISSLTREPVDRSLERQALGISPDQVVYLCIAPARKLNSETVKAQLKILKNVPNSVLLQRGFGNFDAMQALYKEECKAQGIDVNRYKLIPPVHPEEKHRMIYELADVLLDSYPFNGGTLSLETLWFNLPMVTRFGEQFFSRMGYSFLNTLGISDGIASSWEEYIEWGIKFGLDYNLRESVKNKLIQSKQEETLSALWNPQKFAKDLYSLLLSLIFKKDFKDMQIDYLQTAKDYWKVGNFELATANCHKAIEINPNLAEAYSQLGIIYAQKNDLDIAISYFNQAIAINPSDADIHYNLGIALTQKSDIESAIASFEQAINLQPDNINSYINLGIIYQNFQDLESAIFCYQLALEFDPNCTDAYESLADILLEQGRLAESVEYYQLALESLDAVDLNSSNASITKGNLYIKLGNCLYLQEQLEKSLEAYQKALSLEAYQKALSINSQSLNLDIRIREIQWVLEIRGLARKIPQPFDKQTVLHVGCGGYSPDRLHLAFRSPEWQEIRFDIDPAVEPDIIGTLTNMNAVQSSSVSAIWSSHNIEHLYPHEVAIALQEFYRVIKSGGLVLITCPDIQKVSEYVAQGKLETPLYQTNTGIGISSLDILYGWGIYIAEGNYYMAHRTGFTDETLKAKLLDAGFVDVVVCREELNLWAKAYKPI